MRSIVARCATVCARRSADDEAALAQLDRACELFETVSLADDFADFLTLPAYERFVD